MEALAKFHEAMGNLRALTAELGDFVEVMDGDQIVYAIPQGYCTGQGLYWKRDEVGVQRALIGGGGVFPVHHHDEQEVLFVVRGRLRVTYSRVSGEGGVVDLEPGDLIDLQPGTAHTVEALEDVTLIGLTRPASEAYPRVRATQE